MSGDLDAARKQHADLKLTVPLLDGSGLRISYDVDGTPKLMLLDGAASSAATTPAGAAKRRTRCWRSWDAAGRRSNVRRAGSVSDGVKLIAHASGSNARPRHSSQSGTAGPPPVEIAPNYPAGRLPGERTQR